MLVDNPEQYRKLKVKNRVTIEIDDDGCPMASYLLFDSYSGEDLPKNRVEILRIEQLQRERERLIGGSNSSTRF
jgi:hypothetical protein